MTRIRTSRTETTLVRVAGDNNCTGGERQLYRWQGTTIQETTSVQVARHNKLYRWLEIATVQVAGDNCTGGRRQQLYRWQEITNCTCGRRQQIVQVAGDNKQVAGDNKLYRWQETTTESNCVGGRRNNCTGGRRQQLYRWQETTIGGRRQQLYRWQETTVLVAGDNNCIGVSTSTERGIYPPVFSSNHDVAALVQPDTPGIRRWGKREIVPNATLSPPQSLLLLLP